MHAAWLALADIGREGQGREKVLLRFHICRMLYSGGGGGGTLGIVGRGCAAGTMEPLAYTRASSAEFCFPILTILPKSPLS